MLLAMSRAPDPALPSRPPDDGEAAAVAAVESGGAGKQPRPWYGSHSLLDEWVAALEPAAAGARRQ